MEAVLGSERISWALSTPGNALISLISVSAKSRLFLGSGCCRRVIKSRISEEDSGWGAVAGAMLISILLSVCGLVSSDASGGKRLL